MAKGKAGSDEHPPDGTRVGILARAQFYVAHKFRWGDARRSSVLHKTVVTAAAACILLVAAAGCGGGEGVEEGATVTAYAAAPLCVEAKRELARDGGRAGDVRIRVICLADVESGGGLDLAAIGVNARRATQDSTTVAYLEEPNPAATRFSTPILEPAGIAQITSSSGKTAMARLTQAIDQADTSGSLREALYDTLQ